MARRIGLNMPTSQSVQVDRPAPGANSPMPQSVHSVMPVKAANEPAVHYRESI